MLMDKYEPLFFNANFKEAAGAMVAYRGELVLKEGEVADAQGRRKPPVEVMKQAILLTEGAALKLISGSLDEFQYMPALLEKYGPDMTAGTIAVFFVVNIDDPFVTDINGCKAAMVPLVQGMTWNELLDMVALEKGDFKGQGAAEKVVTLYEALKSQKFKYPELALADVKTNANKRENHGAI